MIKKLLSAVLVIIAIVVGLIAAGTFAAAMHWTVCE